MSTPTPNIHSQGVRAPFKSPLRNPVPNRTDPISGRNQDQKESTKGMEMAALEAEQRRLSEELNKNRPEPLDVQTELNQWRERMHAYNEAKDACLEIFGRLAHAKGCLVRELYVQFGLSLDD